MTRAEQLSLGTRHTESPEYGGYHSRWCRRRWKHTTICNGTRSLVPTARIRHALESILLRRKLHDANV